MGSACFLNHVFFGNRSVFAAYTFEVVEHEGTARFARSLGPVLVVPVHTSRSSSGSYPPSFIPPLFHTTTSSPDHPLSRLRVCFHARASLSVADVTPTVHTRETWFPQSPGSFITQAHSPNRLVLFIFALFFNIGYLLFFGLKCLFCCGLVHRSAGFVDAS